MINERIITHFLSYTTAQGCVKDLTAYFPGRIAVAVAKNQRQQAIDAKNEFDEPEWVDDITEIGGIALGTFAVLMPGFGPILTGGPGAGAVIGDVLGDYLETRIRREQPDEASGFDREQAVGPYFVAVDVETEEEAKLAERIMRQHQGAAPHRADAGAPLADELAETGEVAALSDATPTTIAHTPDGWPQETGREQRRIPHEDGYDLDPVALVSPTQWIDSNIGYGNYDIVDPAGIFADELPKKDAKEQKE